MLLRSRGLVAVFCVLFAVAGAWLMGCGAGDVSSLLYTSGLLLPGAGPAPLPDPDAGTGGGDGDEDGGDGGAGQGVICITWENNTDIVVRVMLWSSTSGTISFGDLQSPGNLELLPVDDEGCIDQEDIQGDRVIGPSIQDGARLSYQLTCEDSASLLFGVGDEGESVTAPDDTFGVLRQGVDFDCGDNLPTLNITDDDEDENPEIGF